MSIMTSTVSVATIVCSNHDISYAESLPSTISVDNPEFLSVNDNILNNSDQYADSTSNITEDTSESDKEAPANTNSTDQSKALIDIAEPDETYTGTIVKLGNTDRKLLENLVMGEAGCEGFNGAALVAQAIRDAITYKGFSTVAKVREALKYSGNINNVPNDDTLNAVSYIFDNGGCAVKHKIFYFYAFHRIKSKWHESQKFIIEVGNHRFFSSLK